MTDDKRMSIWGHLAELRRRLTVIVISLLVITCTAYFFADQIGIFLLRPAVPYFENPNNLPYDELVRTTNMLTALEPFTIRFFIAFVTSIVVGSPIWIWQILAFFLPALKPNERKWVLPTFFTAILLFLVGVTFCYLIILDPAFEWLLGQAEGFAVILPSTAEYINVILLFEVAFGIAFELPLVIFYLTVFGIVPYKKLRKSWRVVYVVLLIVCAMVTPDASPVTMLLMFAAMAVLYEFSLLFSRVVLAKRIRALEERARAEGA
ncbi:MAG: twin-arginine translocase subunit TatC [Coriobacteriales bacterium]|jgi:sec-independent protein translocase protein TatC|nr:twin-arginine translocase subunit TatC [Coriobacteriales bacterium]